MFRPFPFIALCVVAPLALTASVARAQKYNASTPGYAQAVGAFQAASVVVLGRGLSKTEKLVPKTALSKSGFVGFSVKIVWTKETSLDTEALSQLFAQYDQYAAPDEKIKNGIKFTDAVTFLKADLKKQTGVGNLMIQMLLERAFQETFGRMPTAAESDGWTARIRSESLWYAPVKLELMKRAKDDAKERIALIDRAYGFSLGRMASPAERKYWLPRADYYDRIVAGNRAWLYRGNGATNELPEIVAMVLNGSKQDASAGSVQKWIARFRADGEKVYGEMELAASPF